MRSGGLGQHAQKVLKKTDTKLIEKNIEEAVRNSLLVIAKSIFKNGNIRPLHYSFYLLVSRFHT